MTAPQDLMTVNAKRGTVLALTLEAALKNVGKLYKLKVSLPDLTTGGGVRSLQHLLLVPMDGSPIVIGHVDAKEKRAELRTLGYVCMLNRKRFQGELPIDPLEYDTFVDAATRALEGLDLRVSLRAAPRERAPRQSAASARQRWAVALGSVLAAAAAMWAVAH